MMPGSAVSGKNNAADSLAQIVGSDKVITDEEERRYYCNDIFFWDEGAVADYVVQPSNKGEVAALVRVAAELDLCISARGGGMSSTNGYRPSRTACILLDLRRLNAILEINTTDRYVTVGAGCTWESISEALTPHGLKLDFAAPFSGVYSTVGGALSQAVPAGMRGILGVEVVRADGSILRTGSWGRKDTAIPFFRDYGPDLSGIFLGDGGAFGIKTAASLHVSRRAEGIAHGSFAFESYQDMAQTMIELGPYDFVTRRVGLDPFKSHNAAKVGFKDAINLLGEVASSGASLTEGFKNTAQMAIAGTNFMDGVKWSLHLSVEAITGAGADAGLDIVRAVCLKRAREISNIIPRAVEARKFSVRGFLGREGQRWVPTNSMWPLSRAVEIATEIQEFFNNRRSEMDKHGVWESYMTNYGPGYFMCEPSFYWMDEVSELHLRHISSAEAAEFRKLKPNLEARYYAQKLRSELRDFFYELGAIHVQLAKFYPYKDSLAPETWRLVKELKNLMDPDGRLNSKNLGFDS